MRHLAWAVSSVAALAFALGCDVLTTSAPIACPLPGFPAIRADVRRGDGRPIGAGATLVVTDGDFKETGIAFESPLGLAAASNRAGTYTVEVSKPFYATRRIEHVVVPGDNCGAKNTVVVPVALEALPDAPAVRSVTIAAPPAGTTVGLHTQYSVWVDAVPGADTSIVWIVSGPAPRFDRPEGRPHRTLRSADQRPRDSDVASKFHPARHGGS